MAAPALCFASDAADSSDMGGRLATVQRTDFRQVVRRSGILKPVKEQRIFAQVAGAILEMAPQGKVVQKGDVLLKLDAVPHEDAKVVQEALMMQEKAAFKRLNLDAKKVLNQATEDVSSYDLRVELENMRLAETKKGPTATDQVNAEVNLENSRNLLVAREDESKILAQLTAGGYSSKEELRQKQLQVSEQKLNVENNELKLRKLARLDPVKISEQELKVREAIKIREAAKERVILLQRNIQRDTERFNRRMERENERLDDLLENIKKTVHLAPGPGVVVHKRTRWYAFAPGREVWDGQEVLSLPDFRLMKVQLTVDESRIAYVSADQAAEVQPAGWTGKPFKGKVIKVADKGRDEFESFQDETTALSGTANRQVFDVEVEIEGQSRFLRPGLRTDVDIIVQTLAQVLVVPRTALVKEKDGPLIVRILTPAGATERRPIKVLLENDLNAVVEGVKEGERIWVLDPQ